MGQLQSDDKLLAMLLREGTVGSPAYKEAVERELQFFEDELRLDLIRLAETNKTGLYEPAVTAKAITRLVFAMHGFGRIARMVDAIGHRFTYHRPDGETGHPVEAGTGGNGGRVAGADLWLTVAKAAGIEDSFARAFPDTARGRTLDFLLRT